MREITLDFSLGNEKTIWHRRKGTHTHTDTQGGGRQLDTRETSREEKQSHKPEGGDLTGHWN